MPGVGGMGGTALEVLARSGVENFIISDPDEFEVSNLNRQIFSNLEAIGKNKAETARQRLLSINPQVQVEILTGQWTDQLPKILSKVDLAINACDDHLATISLMREAQSKGKTVIDAFASTLPNVYVVGKNSPRPEAFLNYLTVGKSLTEITAADLEDCRIKEMIHVLVHSSTAKHVMLSIAGEMICGKRKRISMAPMVWMTGLLMAYEAIKEILELPTKVDHRGVFLNPWSMNYEFPRNSLVSFLRRKMVRRFISSLAESSS